MITFITEREIALEKLLYEMGQYKLVGWRVSWSEWDEMLWVENGDHPDKIKWEEEPDYITELYEKVAP